MTRFTECKCWIYEAPPGSLTKPLQQHIRRVHAREIRRCYFSSTAVAAAAAARVRLHIYFSAATAKHVPATINTRRR